MNTRSGLIIAAGLVIALLGVVMGGAAFIAAPILLAAVLLAGIVWWLERRAHGKEPRETPTDHP